MRTNVRKGAMRVEEKELVIRHSILLITRDVVEQSLAKIQLENLLLRQLYVGASRIALNEVIQDIQEVRKELGKRGIRVYENENLNGSMRVKYTSESQQNDLTLNRDEVKSMVSLNIQNYIGDVKEKFEKATAW
ncbi:hypothetical protein [Paenibacillus sp. FJAT-26967]|uniref:hypothetical protein n=1 Tax=Paenibacillus sp. FJAT-26967 TaxID=1729690 RepID=UPI0012E372D5|nr:hypothetical protein [Paenibacillus sp. FJAT-26967]